MKKVRFASTVIKIFMKNQMQDKTNIILDIFNMFSRCFIVFLLYAYIFEISGGMVNGVDYKTTMWSMFIYFCIMILNLRRLDRLIMTDVKSGNVEMFMNKPINYLKISFYKVIGQGIFSFIFMSLIGSILMILILGIPNVNLIVFTFTFILTFIFGQIIALFLYGIIGIMAFFIEDITPIHWIVDKIVMVLGGSYLPISMFPPIMKVLAYVSPFGAVNFATSTVYESWNDEWIYRVLLQLVWIVVLGGILYILYNKSKKKAMINGG